MQQTKQRMMDMLPNYYYESPEANAIAEGNASEIARKRQEARELLDQFFVRTATWGLSDWERVLDLPPMPNAELTFRRQRILSKLNGTAPATVEYLTNLVNVHTTDRSARIIEYNGEYRFEAEIHASNKISTGDIYKSVEEVKPAHLAFGLSVVAPANILLYGKGYDVDVPYPITNMFQTAAVPGGVGRGIFQLTTKAYEVAVAYPITNVLYPTGNVLNTTTTVHIGAETSVWYAEFQQLNNTMRAGEVTL